MNMPAGISRQANMMHDADLFLAIEKEFTEAIAIQKSLIERLKEETLKTMNREEAH